MFEPSERHPLPWKVQVMGSVHAIVAGNDELVAPIPPGEGSERTADFIVALANREPALVREIGGRIAQQ